VKVKDCVLGRDLEGGKTTKGLRLAMKADIRLKGGNHCSYRGKRRKKKGGKGESRVVGMSAGKTHSSQGQWGFVPKTTL